MKKVFRRSIAAFTSALTAFCTCISWQQPKYIQRVSAADSLLAFPGAVGAGKYTTGGRGGEVYHVTNLNDSGAGSFRDAVSKSGRIVVFDVSGTIELTSNVVMQSNITVAGQTAPGGSGITLKNYKLGMGGTNCIVRYISSRPGPYKATSSGNDAWGGAGGSNSIIDHCSLGWASDEQWGLYSKNDNYTVQYTVVGPANSWGGHDKGIHGFGIMFGRANFTWDHNLILHSVSRNFRGKITNQNAADFTNNVIYDWGYQTTYGTIGHVNYVNNTLKAGNSTVSGFHYASVSDNDNFKLYLTGNRILNKDMSVRNAENANWSAVGYNGNKSEATTRVDEHFPITVNGQDVSTTLTCESAADSYEHVINFVGNGISPDTRTAIDQQCAADTKNGTGSCSGTAAYDSSVTDLDKYHIECGVTYTYPSAVLNKTITDNDNDGMDDEWEELRGLNPNDPTDVNGDYCGQGYTNIEYYINDLTVNSFPEGVVELSPETSQLTAQSAFEQIEAENYSAMEGIRAEDTSDDNGVQNIGFIESGDYVMYKRLDFEDGAKSFTVRASGNACGMELYLDSLTGTPAASVSYSGSGSFAKWEDVTFNIPAISGTHNLYIKFTGGEGYLMNLNWFTFGKEAVPVNGILGKNLLVSDTENGGDWKFAENASVGSLLFGDRTFTITSLPETLNGAEQILTACDSKNTDPLTATFTAEKDLLISVAVDSRVENTPSFLANYTKTELSLTTSNDLTFPIYQTTVSAGDTVTLGSNEQSYQCVNYTVFLQEQSGEPEVQETTEPLTEATEPPTEATEPPTESETTAETIPTEPEATPTEQATTEPETAPTEQATSETASDETSESKVTGDVDGDGVLTVLDVLTLNKNLLGLEPLTEEQRSRADVDQNGTADATDSLNILKAVVKLITL